MSYQETKFETYVREHWRQPEEIRDDLTFIYTCLAGECGEIGDSIKKVYRGKHKISDVILEAGDTLHYLTKLVNYLGYSLEDVMTLNMNKLNKRFTDNPEWLYERGITAQCSSS